MSTKSIQVTGKGQLNLTLNEILAVALFQIKTKVNLDLWLAQVKDIFNKDIHNAQEALVPSFHEFSLVKHLNTDDTGCFDTHLKGAIPGRI